MNDRTNYEGNYIPDMPPEPEALPSTQKRRFKKWLLIPIVTLPLLLIAVCTVFLLSYLTTSPFQRTMEAVFPSLEVLFDMQDKGTVTVDANVGNDLIESLKNHPLHVKAQYGYNQKYSKSLLSLGHNEDTVGAEFIYDGDRLEFASSDLIGDDRYYVEFDGLKKALDDSVFAPKSGSDYALSDEYYELITKALEDRKQSEEAETVLTESLESILSDLEDDLKIETATETVELLSGETKAKVSTLKIDENLLMKALDAFSNEWKTNEELREWGEALWKDSGFEDADTSLDDFIKDSVYDYKQALAKTDLELVIRYAERNGYFVFAEITLSAEQKNAYGEFEKTDLRFTWTFHKDPSKNPDFEITADYALNQKTLFELSVVYDADRSKKSEDFTLTVLFNSYAKENRATSDKYVLKSDLKEDGTLELSLKGGEAWGLDSFEDAEYKEHTNVKIVGSYQRSSRAVNLTVDQITGEFQYTSIKLDKTSLSLRLSESGPWVNPIRRPKDLLSLTEAELKALDAKADKNLSPLAAKINRGLGVDLLEYKSIIDEPYTVEFSYGSVAYDAETQRVFLLESSKKEILVYDALSLTKIGSIPMPTQKSIDPLISADSGKLLLANTLQKKTYLYDASTLKLIREFSLPEAPDDVALDGKYVISYNYDSGTVYHFNINTQDYRKLDICRDLATIVSSPENDVVMICECRYSYQEMKYEYNVAFYNTETGKSIKKDSFYGSTLAAPDYNGYAFSIGMKMYSVEGKPISVQTLPIKNNSDILHYFYIDDRICVTLENPDGYIESYVYVDGKQVTELPNLSEYGKILRLTDTKLLVIHDSELGSAYNYVSVLRVKQVWRLSESLLTLPDEE